MNMNPYAIPAVLLLTIRIGKLLWNLITGAGNGTPEERAGTMFAIATFAAALWCLTKVR